MRKPDELDLQLINVLQYAPRAAWVDVGTALSISPSAAALRWKRLVAEGVAWTAVYPTGIPHRFVSGMLFVTTKPHRWRELAEAFERDPRVVGLDETSRGSRLMLTVMVPTIGDLRSLIDDELLPRRGVVSVNSYVITAVPRQGSDWRLDALDPQQKVMARKLAEAEAVVHDERIPMPPNAQAMIDELMKDGRSSIADLARAANGSPSTVRRHLSALLAAGPLSIRCEMANSVRGWPVSSMWLVRVPPAEMPKVVASLSALSQIRVLLQLLGEANLLIWLFHRSLTDVSVFQDKLGRAWPSLRIVESALLTRMRKQMGWLLDEEGRRTGVLVRPVVLHP